MKLFRSLTYFIFVGGRRRNFTVDFVVDGPPFYTVDDGDGGLKTRLDSSFFLPIESPMDGHTNVLHN